MTDWAQILDGYEAALDVHQAVLGNGDNRVDGTATGLDWSAPSVDQDGVPDEHRARAEALLARTDELARRAALVQQNLPPLPPVRRSRSAYPTDVTPTRLDRTV